MPDIKKEWRKNENDAYMLHIKPSNEEITIIGFYPEKDGNVYRCTWASEIMKIEYDYGYFDSINEAMNYLEEQVSYWIKEQISIYESYLDCLEV